jgi:hypothetical protein
MGAAPEGAQCENAPWTDDWYHTTIVPANDEAREVAEELEQQDHHLTAETLQALTFFALPAAADDDEHEFWLAQAMSPMQCAVESMEDTSGNIIHEGCNYIPCHYLEWANRAKGTYKVETASVNYVDSHLVCVGHLQLEKVMGGWKLPGDEMERVIHATS